MSVMEHLFKFLLLAPYFYFDNWIEKANRNSKFFPIFYYFYWFYIPFYSLFSLAWTVVSVLFFNTVLRNVTDIKLWGIWFLFILLAIGMNWLTYSCFKEMFRLRQELGKSKVEGIDLYRFLFVGGGLMVPLKSFITRYSKVYIGNNI